MVACKSRTSTGSLTISYPKSSVWPSDMPGFTLCARQPDGERAGIVIASHKLHLLPAAIFAHRGAARIRRPHDEGGLPSFRAVLESASSAPMG
jgi:hypothetical protein